MRVGQNDKEKVVVTIDDEQVVFTYTKQLEAYVLQSAYIHSTHKIKVYLIGLPQTPFLWAVFITIIVVAVIAVTGVTVYIIKIRKPRVASGSKGATTSILPTRAHNM